MYVKRLDDSPNLNKEIELQITDLVQEDTLNKGIGILRDAIKRLIDIVFGILGVITLIPLTIAIFIARKILKGEKGPVFYKQLRIGKNGKYFTLYKFRTMIVGADEFLKQYLEENALAKEEFNKNQKLKNDPRVTKLGKFLRKTNLDEWPQFINVLKGDMSLIGPRPIVDREVPLFKDKMDIVHSVKPGISGYWTVNRKKDTTYSERVDMEDFYVKNYSLKLDAKILFRTILSLIRKNKEFKKELKA